MDRHGKIGIFDSGLGGISVLAEVHKLMPNESLIYFGDSLNAPYGIKTKEEVYKLSKVICDQFVGMGCKAIVIACNTATSAAVNRLRQEFEIPIIGMEPAIKPALLKTEGKVLVLATEMTLKEDKFKFLLNKIDQEDRIIKWPAPRLVTLVENDFENTQVIDETIKELFSTLNEPIKALVLGCTHFIFLKKQIAQYFGAEVAIIDGNLGTSIHLKRQLEERGLEALTQNDPSIEILNSKGEAFVEKSQKMLSFFLKESE